jgi:hypothetical protein
MITTINRLAQELEAIATAHLQLQSFHYGDIVQTYNSIGKVAHCTLLCDIKNAVINDGYTSCAIELMVLDRVLTPDIQVGNKPQQEVESDTLQIINDLYFIIGYSARWQAFGMIEQGAAARKVVENTPDKVTGWYISINLRLRNQQGICDLPVIDYDYGQVAYPQNCPGVTIIRNDEFLEIVESGGTFSFTTSGGDPATAILKNTLGDTLSTTEIPCGDTEEIIAPDGNVAVLDQNETLLGATSVASGESKDLVLDLSDYCPVCEDATYTVEYANGDPIQSGSIPSGGNVEVIVPNCDPCPPCSPLVVTFGGYPFLRFEEPCGVEEDVDCASPIELWAITEAFEPSLVQQYIQRTESVYAGVTTSTITIYWIEEDQRWAIQRDTEILYRSDLGFTIDTPITDITWIALDGQPTVPVIEQLTVGTFCNTCQTLAELLAPITADDVIAEVWDNLSEAAQDEILDENCPVCPPADPVEISVAGTPVDDYAAGSSVNVTLVQAGGSVDVLAVTQPDASTIQVKTKWRCSQLVDHITLAENNPFGNTKRFTGLTGGYKVGASYFNAAGGGTTEALAFPNDIVIDWSESHYNYVVAMSRFLNAPVTNGNNPTQLTNIATLNSGAGFAGYTDWGRLSKQFSDNLGDQTLGPLAFNFDPFNQASTAGVLGAFYLQENYAATGGQWSVSAITSAVSLLAVSTNASCRISRIYTFAQLGL